MKGPGSEQKGKAGQQDTGKGPELSGAYQEDGA